MAKTLTAANAAIFITIPGLFDSGQQLQGFSADDVFDTEAVTNAEVVTGVDGKLSSGWVFNPIVWSVMFQADSDSVALFEEWVAAEQQNREKLTCQGFTSLTSLERQYVMNNGVLTSYTPTPTLKKTAQPRKFTITWESIDPSVL